MLIYGLLNTSNYLEFGHLLDDRILQDTAPKTYAILQTIRYLYSNSECQHDLSLNEVEIAFYTYHNALPPKEQSAYRALFNKLRGIESVPKEALKKLLEAYRLNSAIRAAMMIANEVVNGRKPAQAFLDYVAKLQTEDDDDPMTQDFMDMSLEASVIKYSTGGLQWKLRTLQVMFGRLRQGDFGFVFARPDVGKTTLITDQCSHMAMQGPGMLIHFNNEEAGDKIKNRYYQSVLGVTTPDLISNFRRYEKDFTDLVQGRIQIVDKPHMHRRDVEAILQRRQPKLIVLDSIDKIWGFGEKGLRDDLHYKAIYQWARELAKEYGPVIGSCHASAEGANVKWLTMENIAYAKTAKQGEADWILGIGKSSRMEDKNTRFLSACKNKQMGDEESMEKYREAKLPVTINTELGQYDDYLEFKQ